MHLHSQANLILGVGVGHMASNLLHCDTTYVLGAAILPLSVRVSLI